MNSNTAQQLLSDLKAAGVPVSVDGSLLHIGVGNGLNLELLSEPFFGLVPASFHSHDLPKPAPPTVVVHHLSHGRGWHLSFSVVTYQQYTPGNDEPLSAADQHVYSALSALGLEVLRTCRDLYDGLDLHCLAVRGEVPDTAALISLLLQLPVDGFGLGPRPLPTRPCPAIDPAVNIDDRKHPLDRAGWALRRDNAPPTGA